MKWYFLGRAKRPAALITAAIEESPPRFPSVADKRGDSRHQPDDEEVANESGRVIHQAINETSSIYDRANASAQLMTTGIKTHTIEILDSLRKSNKFLNKPTPSPSMQPLC